MHNEMQVLKAPYFYEIPQNLRGLLAWPVAEGSSRLSQHRCPPPTPRMPEAL